MDANNLPSQAALISKKDENVYKDTAKKQLQGIMYAVSGAAVIALNVVLPLNPSFAGNAVSTVVYALIHQAASPDQR